MNNIGVHLMVWSGQIGQAEIERLPAVKEMGYDGVEIPIFCVALWPYPSES
jgi:sugar phosphate isomerase/epimerase